ncbi:hypothetical protein TNCV_1353261 [Trichonephila clavipes]|nr:hypothetical protein TNCV_1353261 [Trichonephila clavipes]
MHRSVPLSVVQLHSPTFVTTSPRAQRPESDVVREERNQWPATTDSGTSPHLGVQTSSPVRVASPLERVVSARQEASACKPTTTTGSAPIPVTSGEKQDRKATVKSDQQQISETSSEQAGRSTPPSGCDTGAVKTNEDSPDPPLILEIILEGDITLLADRAMSQSPTEQSQHRDRPPPEITSPTFAEMAQRSANKKPSVSKLPALCCLWDEVLHTERPQ